MCMPTMLPYYDHIDLIMPLVNLMRRVVVSTINLMVGSFRPKDLSKIYKMRSPNKWLNEQILNQFKEENLDYEEILKGW